MPRELSPYSARRLLTQQQQVVERRSGTPQDNPPSANRDGFPRNGSAQARKGPLAAPTRRSRSRSRERKLKNPSHEPNMKDLTIGAGAVDRKREPSPEPYRKLRDTSRERKREGSRDRKRDRFTERQRDRSRERKRDRSGDRTKDRSKDRRRGHSREKTSEKDRERDRSREGRSRRDRSRSRDRRRKNKTENGRRSRSPAPHRSRKPRTRSPSSSASPPPKRRRRTRSSSRARSPSPHNRAKKPLPSQEISFRGLDDSAQPPSKYGGAPPNKEKPNFKTTGILAKHANRVEGTKISLKYHEPAEARKPPSSQAWRIFVFKGEDVVDTIELAQKSCWLFGRSYEVVDYVLEHPSSSGQHAVIQFRYIQKTVEDEFGVKSKRGKVKPYIIDLESSNGTELNGEPVEASRYFELRDKDILKFAGSEREYVVMLPPPEEK